MRAGQPLETRVSRRGAFRVAVGTMAVGAALVGPGRSAQAQTNSDIEALNFVLNIEYLLAQFLSTAVAEAVPLDRLTGNGIAGTPVRAGRALTFSDTLLRSVIVEMAADNRNHLLPIRSIIGALAVGQPLIDLSSGTTTPFSVAMQRAGVVAAGTAFDPYASEENFLYALFLLKNISVASYRSIAPTIANRVVVQNFAGLLATEAVHLAIVRSALYTRGSTLSRLRENADRIAAFQNALNGGGAFQGIGPQLRNVIGLSETVRVANMAPALATGQADGRLPAQTLNQLYLTSAAVTAGGFFPAGVNGTIRTSANA